MADNTQQNSDFHRAKAPQSKTLARKNVSARHLHITADLIRGEENQSRIAERYGVAKQYISLLKRQAEDAKLVGPKAVWRRRKAS